MSKKCKKGSVQRFSAGRAKKEGFIDVKQFVAAKRNLLTEGAQTVENDE